MSYLNKKYITSALKNSKFYTDVLNSKPKSEQEKVCKEDLFCALEKDVLKELDEFIESFDKSIAADREEKKKMQEEASAKEELLGAIKKYNDTVKDNNKIKIKFSKDMDDYDQVLWGFIDDLFSSL